MSGSRAQAARALAGETLIITMIMNTISMTIITATIITIISSITNIMITDIITDFITYSINTMYIITVWRDSRETRRHVVNNYY